MKSIAQVLSWMVVFGASVAYAAPAGGSEGGSLLGYLFLGFFALIVVSQLVPACILFYGMIKGVFAGREEQSEAGVHNK